MSSATEETRYAIVSRRRKAFYLQRPDGTPMSFPSREAATAVCEALNREDPNDEEPECEVTEIAD